MQSQLLLPLLPGPLRLIVVVPVKDKSISLKHINIRNIRKHIDMRKLFVLQLFAKDYYYSTPCEICTPTLADGFSLGSKWQQITSSILVLNRNTWKHIDKHFFHFYLEELNIINWIYENIIYILSIQFIYY